VVGDATVVDGEVGDVVLVPPQAAVVSASVGRIKNGRERVLMADQG